MSLETQGNQTFLAGYPGILPGYPGSARKVWEKKVWVQFPSPIRGHTAKTAFWEGFWEGFWGRVLEKGSQKGSENGVCYGFCSKKGSEKGSQTGFWERGVSRRCLERALVEYAPLGVRPILGISYLRPLSQQEAGQFPTSFFLWALVWTDHKYGLGWFRVLGRCSAHLPEVKKFMHLCLAWSASKSTTHD